MANLFEGVYVHGRRGKGRKSSVTLCWLVVCVYFLRHQNTFVAALFPDFLFLAKVGSSTCRPRVAVDQVSSTGVLMYCSSVVP